MPILKGNASPANGFSVSVGRAMRWEVSMIRGPIFDATVNSFAFVEHSLPEVSASQVLVDVAFAGLNRADLEQAHGHAPPPKGESLVLGLEASGRVRAVGADVTEFKVGDEVFGLASGGAFGTQVLLEESLTFARPQHLTLEECAILPESLFTFWANAVISGGLKRGENFLVHGGASGLGSFSVAMASLLGAQVFSTARGEARCAFVKNLGARLVINTEDESYEELRSALMSAGHFDVILDHVGTDYLDMHVHLLNKLGTLILLNNLGSAHANLDLAVVISKRLRIIGSVLRGRSPGEKSAIARKLRTDALPLMIDADLKPALDSVIDMQDLRSAFDRLESRQNNGKIALRVQG